jgi:hypothetical protein
MENRRALTRIGGRLGSSILVCLFAGNLAAPSPALAQRPIARWLDAYAAGRHDEVVSAIAEDDHFEAVVRAFPAGADEWVRAEPDERELRRRVHGVLLLEIVRLSLDRSVQTYGALRESVERYCSTLREGSPTEFERLWLLASVALLAGAHDEEFLAAPARRRGGVQAREHALHAAWRFPDEPRFPLALVTAPHEVNVLSYRPGAPLSYLVFGRYAPSARPGRTPDDAAHRVRVTLENLDRLAGDPRVGPEARLRSGVLRFQLGDFERSLSDLQWARNASDRWVSFLGDLVSGVVLTHLERAREAGASYRAAAAARPQAYSAAVVLASHLFLHGAPEEAAAVLEEADRSPAESDPWREYSFGDFRFWPAYLQQLRHALASRESR